MRMPFRGRIKRKSSVITKKEKAKPSARQRLWDFLRNNRAIRRLRPKKEPAPGRE